jgi:hypothetical protein
LTDTPRPGWPSGVEPIGVEDLNRLGIDREHQIYWEGRPIEIRKSIVLTGFQKFIASVVTVVGLLAALATFATGVNNASAFLCARHVTWLSCPAP